MLLIVSARLIDEMKRSGVPRGVISLFLFASNYVQERYIEPRPIKPNIFNQ